MKVKKVRGFHDISHAIVDSEGEVLFYVGREWFYDECFQPVSEKQHDRIFFHPVFQNFIDRMAVA